MTSVGTGVGGNVGGPAIPLQRDIETTAWTEYNKASLGIVPDSIDKSFAEVNPRYTPGYLGGFGYKTTAENPMLSHPLESQRQSELSPEKTTDETLQKVLDNLLSQIPPDLLARYTNDKNKSSDQRSLDYVGMENLYKAMAKTITESDRLAQPEAAGSLEDARTSLNRLLPFVALKGAIGIGNEVVGGAQGFLTEQGANYRYFDGFNNVLNQLQKPLALLDKVNASLSDTVDGQLNPQAKADAGKAAQQLGALASQLERTSLGTDLQLMLSNIRAIEVAATALSLPNTNSAPLFIALSMASNGIFTSESPGGMLGPSFEALVNNVSDGVLAGLIPKNSKGGNELLSLLVTVSLPTFIGLAGIALNTGLGTYPNRDEQDLKAAQFFTFEAALQMAVSSGILETFYKEAIAISGGSDQAQEVGGTGLAQLAHLLMILAVAQENKSKAARLVENQQEDLRKGAIAADEIEKATEKEHAEAAIAIKLSTLALDSKDYEAFLEAFNTYLESLGFSQDTLKEDLTQINRTSESIADVARMGDPNQRITGIVNIA